MPVVALFEIQIQSPRGRYCFASEVYRTEDAKDRLLPESFYEMGEPPNIPKGIHHEMRLTDSPAWGRVNSEVPIHVYKKPGTHEHYVCWTMPVPTLEDAKEIFRWWCLGTVYSLEHDQDFAALLGEHSDDMPAFLKKSHGIEIVE